MAGSPMITADLRKEPGFASVGKNRVARIMKINNLRCKAIKKFRTTTDFRHNEPVCENILNRQFSVSAPNKVWVSDITYLKVGRLWCYLVVFIDLYSIIIVGWDLSGSLERHSTISAFKKAIIRRNPEPGLMIHSDRGIQYASNDFRILLKKHDCIQSMSRKANCWDNAVSESFFHTLKTQYTNHVRFEDFQSAEQGLFQYIEVYYNRRRRHSSNGYESPANFEAACQKIAVGILFGFAFIRN
jgi:putative transposase